MIRISTQIFFAIALLIGAVASPSTAQAAETASVLGVLIGQSSLEDVRSMIHEHGGRITRNDTSAVTQGALLIVQGNLGLEGLSETAFLFDTSGKLALAALTLSKHRYDAVLASLRSKYRYVSGNKPFVGNADATLRAGDVEIRLEAPHMSFEMSAIYGTDAAWKQLADNQRQQAEAKQRAQDSRL